MNQIGNEWGYLFKVKLFETVIPICPPACDTYNYSSGAVKEAFSKFKTIKYCKNDRVNDSNDTSLFQMGAATFLATLALSLFATLHFFGRRWRWWDNEIDYWPQMEVVHHRLKTVPPHLLLVVVWFFIHHWSHPIFTTEQVVPVNIYPHPPSHFFTTCVL